jgi:hypothetical protein
VTWPPMNLFKLENLNHHLLNLKILNLSTLNRLIIIRHMEILKEHMCMFIITMMCMSKIIMQLFIMTKMMRPKLWLEIDRLMKSITFCKLLIDLYVLGVSNPKGCVHSQQQGCFQLKLYKEPP